MTKKKEEIAEKAEETNVEAEAVETNNIAFVGKRTPPRKINNGMETIHLPEDQSKPFFHKQASVIIRIAPELFKPVKEIK